MGNECSRTAQLKRKGLRLALIDVEESGVAEEERGETSLSEVTEVDAISPMLKVMMKSVPTTITIAHQKV